MKGYWNNPEATAEAIPDGWFRTGDLATMDDEGYFTIVDRKKDMILRGGMNVYPREVEEVIYTHPDVTEVAVIGVPDDLLGENVAAAVALREGSTATPEDIIAFTKERIAAYKYPRQVWVVAELPKGPTGKILRREVKRTRAPGEGRGRGCRLPRGGRHRHRPRSRSDPAIRQTVPVTSGADPAPDRPARRRSRRSFPGSTTSRRSRRCSERSRSGPTAGPRRARRRSPQRCGHRLVDPAPGAGPGRRTGPRGLVSVHDRAAGRTLVEVTVAPDLTARKRMRSRASCFDWAERGGARDRRPCAGCPAPSSTPARMPRTSVSSGWLATAGYTRVRTWLQMTRPVDHEECEPGGVPGPREGVTIRRVATHEDGSPVAHDLQTVHRMLEESFADHFNSYRESFPEFVQRLREDPGHRWDHWWIAEVDEDGTPEPGGALVASMLGPDDSGAEGTYVDYIGVHRRARGRGVAKAFCTPSSAMPPSVAATGSASRSTPTPRPARTASTPRWAGRRHTRPSPGTATSPSEGDIRGRPPAGGLSGRRPSR